MAHGRGKNEPKMVEKMGSVVDFPFWAVGHFFFLANVSLFLALSLFSILYKVARLAKL